MPRRVDDEWMDGFIEQQVDLLKMEANTRNKVLDLLGDTADEIKTRLAKFDAEGVSRDAFKYRKQEALLREITGTIATAYRTIDKTMQQELIEIADWRQNAFTKLGNHILQTDIFTVALTPNDLKYISGNLLIEGAPSSEWWKKQSADTQARFSQQLRLGVTQGETNDQLASRLLGKYSGRKKVTIDGKTKTTSVYNGGTMDVTRAQANSLVRSSVQTVSNEVLWQTYKDNADVIKGVELLITLDLRTSDICKARGGARWDLNGKPLPDSPIQIPFPGRPPYHWQCRSVLKPITYSWDELIENANKGSATAFKEKVEEIPPTTRAAMGGPISAKTTTYDEWLKGRSEAEQLQSLGRTRFDLWKSGKLTSADLIDQSGDPRSAKELKASFGKAPIEINTEDPAKTQAKALMKKWDQDGQSMLDAYKAADAATKKMISDSIAITSIDAWQVVRSTDDITAELQTWHTDLSKAEALANADDSGKAFLVKRAIQPYEILADRFHIDGKEELVVMRLFNDRSIPAERGQSAILALHDKGKLVRERAVAYLKPMIAKGKELRAAHAATMQPGGDFSQRINFQVKITQQEDFIRKVLRAILEVPNATPITFTVAAKAGEDIKLGAAQAVEFINGLVRVKRSSFNIIWNRLLNPRSRAYASGSNAYLTTRDDLGTFIHEAMHVLEFQELSLDQKARKFLADRAAKDPRGLRKLKDIVKSSNYSNDEVAWEDSFLSPYMGKKYMSRHSEILSMGVEYLWRDPAKLIDQDPEYFDVLIDILRSN